MNERFSPKNPTLGLHKFLHAEREAILEEWERIDRSILTVARKLSREDQRNNIPAILDTIAEHAKRAGDEAIEEISKRGGEEHAEQRRTLGFSLEEVTREYGILRTVIVRKLASHSGMLSTEERVFLYEALDNAIVEAVVTYVAGANQALEEEREHLQVTLRSISDGVVTSNAEGVITYLNPAAEHTIGWTRQEALGRPVHEVMIAIEAASGKPSRSIAQIASETGEPTYHLEEILLQQRDGQLLPAEEVAAPLRDSKGKFLGVVTTFRDVSKVRALTSQLGYLAAHDPLTGLPNRSLLVDRLGQEIAHAERHGSRIAILYMDLDLFKDVNDMLGHAAGDALLEQVARRLESVVRRADTVCRLGGDEFVILLTEFEDVDYLSELSSKIARKIRVPYQLGDETVEISTSIGISIFPDDGEDTQSLMKHADIAMYQAKEHGRNDIQFFAPAMNRRATERRELQTELRKALVENQMSLHFQPQISLGTGTVVGAEVLLRWLHPQLGSVSPARFIPVAEDSREIMISIGEWVLEQACKQARKWLDAGYPPLRLSVNVSIAQLRCERFLQHVKETLEQYHLPPDQLQVELTESLLMSDVAGALRSVRALEKMGVRISVDDFGTGYSSLSYLQNLPVDELKIDQSFIQNITAHNSAPIIQAIIRMGQSLHLRIIAEGVEDQESVDFLAVNGCEAAQGFYFSKPLNAEIFERRFLHPRP